MSRKEDVLFCEIAITSGLVSKDAAQKVLAFCNKKEKEAGRRPLIGPIFTKYNLLNTQDVQRLYEAVRKRTGTAVGAERAVSTPRQGRAGRGGGGRRPAPRRQRREIDRATLWQGIGGGVAFVVLAIVIIYMLTRSGSQPAQPEVVDIEDRPAASEPRRSSRRERAEKEAAAEKIAPVELSEEELQVVNLAIADHRTLNSDNPERALKALEALRDDITEKRKKIPPQELLDEIEEYKARAEAAGSAPEEPVEEPAVAAPESPDEGADEDETPSKGPGEEQDRLLDEEFDNLGEE